MASFFRWSFVCLSGCWHLAFILAELQVRAPTSAPAVTLVAGVGSSYLPLVRSWIGSARAAFCCAVPPLRKHPLARKAVLRLAPTGFTARFLGFLSVIVTFFRCFGLGVGLIRRGGGPVQLWLLWFVVSGRAHRSVTALSRDILGTY